MKTTDEILSHREKTLDEAAELVGMTPREILEVIVNRDRTALEPAPSAGVGAELAGGITEDQRSDDQLAEYFLNRLKKESLSVSALNNKYKVNDEEKVEGILEKLVREGKLVKRESKNKKGRFVYEAA